MFWASRFAARRAACVGLSAPSPASRRCRFAGGSATIPLARTKGAHGRSARYTVRNLLRKSESFV